MKWIRSAALYAMEQGEIIAAECEAWGHIAAFSADKNATKAWLFYVSQMAGK